MLIKKDVTREGRPSSVRVHRMKQGQGIVSENSISPKVSRPIKFVCVFKLGGTLCDWSCPGLQMLPKKQGPASNKNTWLQSAPISFTSDHNNKFKSPPLINRIMRNVLKSLFIKWLLIFNLIYFVNKFIIKLLPGTRHSFSREKLHCLPTRNRNWV